MKKVILVLLILAALQTNAHAKKLGDLTREDLCKPFCWIVNLAVDIVQTPFALLESVADNKHETNLEDIINGN